jgi:hypothetical protein
MVYQAFEKKHIPDLNQCLASLFPEFKERLVSILEIVQIEKT